MQLPSSVPAPQLSQADLAARAQRAALVRAQIQAWVASLPVKEKVARLEGLAERTKAICKAFPEPFIRNEWNGMPHFTCYFCWFGTLWEPVAWLHYRKEHWGRLVER